MKDQKLLLRKIFAGGSDYSHSYNQLIVHLFTAIAIYDVNLVILPASDGVSVPQINVASVFAQTLSPSG
jgi:hypothetical protein